MGSSFKGVLDPTSYVFHRPYRDANLLQRRLLDDRLGKAANLYRRDLRGHFGCVNAIEFSKDGGEWIASGGDDHRVIMWRTEESISGVAKPIVMKGLHHSNIFCLSFDSSHRKIFSGGNDEQVIVHDTASGQTLDVFSHEEAVYGLSVDPTNDNMFASACDDGRILIHDTRAPPGEDPFVLAASVFPMHAVMYNPSEARMIATANSRDGVALWDVRMPKVALLKYGSRHSCTSVCVNRAGTHILALRRRLPPVLYSIDSSSPVCQFDNVDYFNSCTMKSCCFAGSNDEYIMSGSDDFNLYMWKIPEENVAEPVRWVNSAHLVLKGHRSIVNQVRFNPSNHLIISSGVEKIIKMWSPMPLPGSTGNLGEVNVDSNRRVYSHEEYLNMMLRTGHLHYHDYTEQSMEEDPRMMAFFDSLVQRELEGWSSDNHSESNSDIVDHVVEAQLSDDELPSSAAGRVNSDNDEQMSSFSIAFANVLMEENQRAERDLVEMMELGGSGAPQNGERIIGPLPETESRIHHIQELLKRRRQRYLSRASHTTEDRSGRAGQPSTSTNKTSSSTSNASSSTNNTLSSTNKTSSSTSNTSSSTNNTLSSTKGTSSSTNNNLSSTNKTSSSTCNTSSSTNKIPSSTPCPIQTSFSDSDDDRNNRILKPLKKRKRLLRDPLTSSSSDEVSDTPPLQVSTGAEKRPVDFSQLPKPQMKTKSALLRLKNLRQSVLRDEKCDISNMRRSEGDLPCSKLSSSRTDALIHPLSTSNADSTMRPSNTVSTSVASKHERTTSPFIIQPSTSNADVKHSTCSAKLEQKNDLSSRFVGQENGHNEQAVVNCESISGSYVFTQNDRQSNGKVVSHKEAKQENKRVGTGSNKTSKKEPIECKDNFRKSSDNV